jgi:hypothetical protein
MFPDMPVLRNIRQERFCQLLKQGVPALRAYPMAGYKPDKRMGAPYRLSGSVRIKARIAELTRHIAMKTRVTVESLTAELDEARALALRCDQPSAAITATATKGKLHGLMVDRKESGAPGDFAGLKTPDEVLALIRSELGEDAARMLQANQQVPEAAPEASQGDMPSPLDTIN